MIIGLRILIWLITTILLSNCTLGPTNAAGPAPVPTDRSTVVGRRPATFTESYRWADGLAVEVVEVNHGRLLASIPVDAPTAHVGDSCSELTIVVRNGSDHMVRIALTARLRYGPDMTSAATYVATAGHADHATGQYVDPGEVSYPYTLGFVLPRRGTRRRRARPRNRQLDARTCGVRRFDRCRLALAISGWQYVGMTPSGPHDHGNKPSPLTASGVAGKAVSTLPLRGRQMPAHSSGSSSVSSRQGRAKWPVEPDAVL